MSESLMKLQFNSIKIDFEAKESDEASAPGARVNRFMKGMDQGGYPATTTQPTTAGVPPDYNSV